MDYDGEVGVDHAAGRALSPAAAAVWAHVLRGHFPRGARVLDLGCGTGRMASVLEAAGARPIGLDASRRMLAQRARAGAYVAGDAGRLPFARESLDGALLSMVLHHLPDRPRAFAELARALRPGSRVVFRSEFAGRLDSVLYRWFPAARAVDEARMPRLDEVAREARAAGLEPIGLRRIVQPVAGSLAEYHARLEIRAYSTLHLLPEEDVRAGLAALAAAAAEGAPGPVTEPIDVVVFSR